MFKKVISASIILVISFGVFSVSAADSSFSYKGNKYVVTSSDTVKLVKGQNTKDVVIPSTVKKNKKNYYVTSVGKTAYKNFKKVKSVTIGRYVKSIEEGAFEGLSGLKAVKGGKNLARIGSKAFKGDSNLTSFKTGKAVVSISADAFQGSKIKASKIKTTNRKIYKALINAIVTDFKAGFANNTDDGDYTFSPQAGKKVQGLTLTSYFKEENVNLSNVGYTFMDIDSNGTSELIIYDGDSIIYDIYTFADGKYVSLDSCTRSYHELSINKQKNIYAHNYWGAQTFASCEYKIKGNGKELCGIQALISMGSGVERDFDFGYGGSKVFKKTSIDEKKMKGISYSQYIAKQNKMSASYDLKGFTPLDR